MNTYATAALLAIAIAQLSMAYMAAQPTPEQIHFGAIALGIGLFNTTVVAGRIYSCLTEHHGWTHEDIQGPRLSGPNFPDGRGVQAPLRTPNFSKA